jgi:hypothetical protein
MRLGRASSPLQADDRAEALARTGVPEQVAPSGPLARPVAGSSAMPKPGAEHAAVDVSSPRDRAIAS